MHEAGFEVTVIATRVLDGVEPRDQSIMRGVSWKIERIDLRSRLRWRSLRLFQLAARRAHGRLRMARLADLGLSAFTLPLINAARNRPADLYIAHYPPALPAAALAAAHHGSRFAYDAEDFHPGDWPDSHAFDAERRLIEEVESRHLPNCVYVSAASPLIADAYSDTYRIDRPIVVLNTFPISHAPIKTTAKGVIHPGPSLYWFSQTIGPHRGLECAVRAIGLASSRPHLYLRGTLAAGYEQQLKSLATEAGADNRVHILPPAEPERMEALAAPYDLGLCGEIGHSRSRLLALTNKLFSFILAGLPPLLSNTPAQSAFAAEAGLQDLLYPMDDSSALAKLIDSFLDNQARLAAMRAYAHRLGQERYNWERERTSIIEAVRSATSNKVGAEPGVRAAA